MLPEDLLTRWSLPDPLPVADTPTGTVRQVTQPDGQPAALKLLRPGEVKEARGADYLAALGGAGAVQVLARNGDAILREWCAAPPLATLSVSGRTRVRPRFSATRSGASTSQ